MTEKNKARKVFDKMFSTDYYSQWLQIEPISIEEGSCVLRMKVRKEMLNGFGILHGGVAYALADSAFAFAANSYGRIAVSINGMMTYAKACTEGEVLIAQAQVLNVSHKLAEFKVDITEELSGEICYRFKGQVYRKSQFVLES